MPRLVTFEGKLQSFPDDATDAEISAALKAIPASNAAEVPKARTWTETAAEYLPLAGGIAGSMAGGTIGAAVGGAAGRGYAELAKHASEIPGAIADVAHGLVEHPKETLSGFVGGGGSGALSAGEDAAKQTALNLGGKAVAAVVPSAGPVVGKALDKIGFALEKAGLSEGARQLARGGGAVELFRGDLGGTAAAIAAPHAAKVAGQGMQAAGRALTGAPNELGMVQALYDAATRPTSPIALNPWEASFVSSVADQMVNMSRPLSVPQREVLRRIFATKLP